MKNKYIKHFTLLASLVFGATGVFAQETNSDCDIDSPKEEHLHYTRNVNNLESVDPDRFVQNLNPDYDLVWYTTDDPSKEPNSLGQEKMTFDRSKAGSYLFYIAYKDGECYSERARVEVEVLAAPKPTVKNIDLCKNATFDPMDGIVSTDEPDFELIWFIDPADTVGNALTSAPTGIVDENTRGKYTYHVAQRQKAAPYTQSEIQSFDVIVYDVMAPVNKSKLYYCANDEPEELKAEIQENHASFLYADDIVFVSGEYEQPTFKPDTKVSSSAKYDYSVYATYTTPEFGYLCKSQSVDFSVEVVAVAKPNVDHGVSYVKSEGTATKEFVDILVKDPDAITDVPGQTLLWAKKEYGQFEKGSTSSSKPFYDEMVPFGEVEHQERWVKWQVQTTTGLTCESEASKVDITISSSPAPYVRNIEICEDVFKSAAGSPIADLEPIDNASLYRYNDLNLADYKLYWFEDPKDAVAAELDPKILSHGSTTAPSLAEVFANVDMKDNQATEWTKSLYVVQSDGIITSPASKLKITINATPKLVANIYEPACYNIDLTSNKYWAVTNVIMVDVYYMHNGFNVTQNATNLTESGKYEVIATSSKGCKSDPLPLQLDIRSLSINMERETFVCSGKNVENEIAIKYDYNKDVSKPSLEWTSTEMISEKPTQKGVISADETKFIYESGNFVGEIGDVHTIEITVTDGYCIATAEQKVTITGSNAVISISANDPDEIINVYTITGALVKSNIKRSEALNGLANGAYVVGGVKVIVNK